MSSTVLYLQPTTSGSQAFTPMAGLLQVALAINEGNTPEEVIDRFFDAASAVVPFDRIGLALLQDNGELVIRHTRANAPITWGIGDRAHYRDSSLAPIIEEGKIRIIPDLEAYYRAHPHSYTAPKLLEEGVRSSLTLPLRAKRGVIGVLFFSSYRANAYQPAHAELLQAIAAGLGVAVERGELIEELRQANASLASLDRLKTTFLSNLSHELRTPLTVIASYTYALQDDVAGQLTPEQHRYLQTIIEASDRLKLLLGQLFDLTELESGLLEVVRVPMDLAALARDVAGAQTPPAGVTFEVDLPEAPMAIAGDPQRLRQVLTTLLENAFRFTPPPGRVWLRGGEDVQAVWLEVTDTGIGIAPENQPRVFEKFYQVDASATRARGGSGLSLALARAIARAHGGDLQLVSAPGEGSTFRLTLPRG